MDNYYFWKIISVNTIYNMVKYYKKAPKKNTNKAVKTAITMTDNTASDLTSSGDFIITSSSVVVIYYTTIIIFLLNC